MVAFNTENSGKGGNLDSNKPVLITKNIAMLELLYKIKLVAKTKASLLISGENGTGKELLAQLAHFHSNRKNKKLFAVNTGAIPSELVESELFGHEKGAFTGAYAQKQGVFELADNSTLFLDEVSEMSMDIQVKLLRAVELGSFRRVGGKEEVDVDVRLISATNKDLLDQIKSGKFREDLYYRLNVIELQVPPLRHRKEDIPIIIDYYNEYFSKTYGLEKKTFSKECIDLFMDYDWPGNVRQLKNIVERSLVLTEDTEVTMDVIPPQLLNSNHSQKPHYFSKSYDSSEYIQLPIGASLEEIEKRVINETLNYVSNNKTEAAKILGVSRKTLHNKLDRYEENQKVSN